LQTTFVDVVKTLKLSVAGHKGKVFLKKGLFLQTRYARREKMSMNGYDPRRHTERFVAGEPLRQ
jgi:hypothetical protein